MSKLQHMRSKTARVLAPANEALVFPALSSEPATPKANSSVSAHLNPQHRHGLGLLLVRGPFAGPAEVTLASKQVYPVVHCSIEPTQPKPVISMKPPPMPSITGVIPQTTSMVGLPYDWLMDLEIWPNKSIPDICSYHLSLSLSFTTYSQYLFVPSNLLQKLSKVFFRYICKPSNISWAPPTISAVWPLHIWLPMTSLTITSLQPTSFVEIWLNIHW